jgi:ADP-heptose:LPS heptosyltransferase
LAPPQPHFLIVRLSSGGDIVVSLPALRALTKAFPGARVTWLVDEAFAGVLGDIPEIDVLVVVPFRAGPSLLRSPRSWIPLARAWWRAWRALRGGAPYDASLDFHGAFRGAAFAGLVPCRSRIAVRSGKPRGWWPLLPARRIVPRGPHLADGPLTLAAHLGAADGPPQPYFVVPPSARDYASEMVAAHSFGSTGPLIGLAPSTSEASKCWAPERFATLARRLYDTLGARIVLVGAPADVALSQGIIADAGVPALCAAGRTTWPQLAGLLEQCATLVCGDTGPMHLAAAVGTPVVALFGPTVPEVSRPLGEGHIILERPLPCRPCNPRRACPGVDCMAGITVDEVAEAVSRILRR